jgi:hypothetical protein
LADILRAVHLRRCDLNFVSRLASLSLLIAAVSALGVAAVPVGAPEIDPGMGLNALALLGGVVLVVRSSLHK